MKNLVDLEQYDCVPAESAEERRIRILRDVFWTLILAAIVAGWVR